jgi:hypothetical protein
MVGGLTGDNLAHGEAVAAEAGIDRPAEVPLTRPILAPSAPSAVTCDKRQNCGCRPYFGVAVTDRH